MTWRLLGLVALFTDLILTTQSLIRFATHAHDQHTSMSIRTAPSCSLVTRYRVGVTCSQRRQTNPIVYLLCGLKLDAIQNGPKKFRDEHEIGSAEYSSHSKRQEKNSPTACIDSSNSALSTEVCG